MERQQQEQQEEELQKELNGWNLMIDGEQDDDV
jgi:hypothetical protein